MKKNLTLLATLVAVSLTLVGCSGQKESPVTSKDESTVIKNAKSTDEYLKKEDYKSIAYAYISHIKDETPSYESETNGTVKAKVAFIDYNIKYNTVTYKNGSTFYSKEISTSTLMNLKNEYYMTGRDRILVSRDLKKYDVYTMEDYSKISYAVNQYTIMGYVFNDQSITKAELVNDKGDTITIKYTLDNEAGTNLVRLDLKNNGGLSTYPSFKSVELTFSMKRDFTPVSYTISSIYDATRPVIGTAEVKQNAECNFTNVNGSVTIPNEAFLKEKLGADPSEVVINDEEEQIKNDLNEAFKKLDFANGVNVNGNISLALLDKDVVLNIDTNLAFDTSRLSKDKIYDVLSLYAKLEGDETFSSLATIIKMFAGDKLGEYAPLLDNFKSVEAVYDGAGSLYLIPTDRDDVHQLVMKIKLTDIIDLLLKQINVYNLVTGVNTDVFSYKRIDGADQNNYQVEITLSEEIAKQVKTSINDFLAQPDYSLIKTLIGYKDFDCIKMLISVSNGAIKSLDASVNYITNDDTSKALVKAHLEASNKTFDYQAKIDAATVLYNDYNSILDLKARLQEMTKNVYVSRLYLSNLESAYEEYNALSEQQKNFIGKSIETDIKRAINDVKNILLFLETYVKYDLSHLTNNDVLALAKAYHLNILNGSLLSKEIGQDNYSIISNLNGKVDYTNIDAAINKINGEDETTWGLTEQEIRDCYLVLEISTYEGAVKGDIFLKLFMSQKGVDFDTFKTKITNLYNNL